MTYIIDLIDEEPDEFYELPIEDLEKAMVISKKASLDTSYPKAIKQIADLLQSKLNIDNVLESKQDKKIKKLTPAQMRKGIEQMIQRSKDIDKKYKHLDDYIVPDLPKPKKKRKVKKVVKKNTKKVVKKNTGGLSDWRVFLNNYRSQNPNVPYRQAQKQASILYKQR